MGDVIQFVPRNSVDRRPMIEQPQSLVEAALDVVHQISAPRCHDDLTGGSVLEYETSLGYWPKEPA